MKFKVKTSDFQKAINSVEGVITVREIKSILSNIKVEAEDGRVFLSATDLEKDFPLQVFNKVFSTQHMLLHLLTHLSYHLGQVNYHRRLMA